MSSITPWACNEPLVPGQLLPSWYDGTVVMQGDTSISVWNVPTSQYYSLSGNVLDYYLVYNESLPTTPALAAANFTLLAVSANDTVSPICGVPFPPYTFHSRILANKDDGSFHVGPIPCVLESEKIIVSNVDPKTNDGGDGMTMVHWMTIILIWITILFPPMNL